MKKFLISILLCLATISFANGTTLVAFRNANMAVLASDSRYSTLSTHAEMFSGNKIKRCGNYFMAISGFYTITSGGSVIDLSRVPMVCKAGQTPLQSIDAVMQELELTYSRMLLKLKQASLFVPLSKTGYQSSELTLNIILVGSFKGTPFIIVRNLEPAFQKEEIVLQSERPWTLMTKLRTGVTQYAFGGAYTEMNSYARQNNLDQPKTRLVETARHLVGYQINRTPEVSGYPIHIVSVSALGKVRWLTCNDICQDPDSDLNTRRKAQRPAIPSMTGKSPRKTR